MKNKMPKLQTWLIIMTAVTGTYAGAAALGLPVPRPVWLPEFMALADEVLDNRIKLYRGDVKDLRSQLRDARVSRSRVDSTKSPRLYEELLKDEEDLKGELEDAKDELRRVRNRK